jgi:glycine cleavage system regulatory protein
LQLRHVRNGSHSFIITALKQPGQIGKIGAYFGEAGINIRDIHSSDDDALQHLDIAVRVEVPTNITASEVRAKLLAIEGILAVKIE